MSELSILFLGASKRVSLVERFLDSGRRMGVNLRLYSCEAADEFYPISAYAQVLPGPRFDTSEFQGWLQDIVRTRGIDLIIPNMDSATVALSQFKEGRPSPPWAVVSDLAICQNMLNKRNAEAFFREHGIPAPDNTPGRFPKIIKPVKGFGSHGILVVTSEEEMELFLHNHGRGDHLVQDFIDGQETTVDLYISPRRGPMGYVLRDRLEVSDGEVMTCQTRDPSDEERKVIEKVMALEGWCGCITLQYITDGDGKVFVTEINPRFGGGATCAIECGLDMPTYMLSEYLGRDLVPPASLKRLRMTRCRRDYFHGL